MKKSIVILSFLILFIYAAASSIAQSTYQPPKDSLETVKKVPWASAIEIGNNFRQTFFGCDSCKKGDTYPCPNIKNSGKVLKNGCSADKNRNTALLKFPDGVIFFDGKMALDADGSAYAKKKAGDGINQAETSFQIKGKSLDASKIPFIVIPQNASSTVSFKKSLGLGIGDIVAVIYKNKIVYAIVGDEGPSCRIGEGSVKLHEELDHHVCKNQDCSNVDDRNGIEKEILYFVFPDTDVRKINGLTLENINQHIEERGNELFSNLLKN